VCANHLRSREREMFNSSCSDGREARRVMGQTANDVDQVIRSSSLYLIGAYWTEEPYASFQKTNCGRASTDGSPHRIRQLTITLPVIPITRKLRHGSSRETFTRNGNQMDHSFGSMESVRPVLIFHSIPPDDVLTI
jgi:hypothetical protein